MQYINPQTVRLSPFNINSFNNKTMAVWASEIRRIRNDSNILFIEWGDKNTSVPPIITVSRADFLNAINNRLGTLRYASNKSPYVIFSYQLFSNTSAKKRAKVEHITDYSIVPTTENSFGIRATRKQKDGSSKEKLISKFFKTEAEAISYIRGPLRRPDFNIAK